VESHVRIGSRFGAVVVGEDNFIQSGATLGGPPQDWSYDDQQTRLEVGNGNRIGEGASLNLGSEKGGGVTRVGNNTFIMALAHVGHDSQVSDDVVLTHLAGIAGHVIVECGVVIGGSVAVAQFARLGEYSFIAGGALVNKDILPYTIAAGHWAAPKATNKVGLKRAGLSAEEIRQIDRAIKIALRRSLTVREVVEEINRECVENARITHLLDFINSSKRGIARA